MATRTSAALARLVALRGIDLVPVPTPLYEMRALRDTLGGASRGVPRLFVKRDDLIPFGFGGNKVRKLQFIAALARREQADTLITVGGLQSNHARATAALAKRLGLACVLVLNGEPPGELRANTRVARDLFGAELEFIPSRNERAAAMEATASRLRAAGRRPLVVPLGASTPLGALGMALGVGEVAASGIRRVDAIVHATSSGGTQAGILAGCALNGIAARVIGISADDPAQECAATIARIRDGAAELLEIDARELSDAAVEVDDSYVGDGYGIPTDASREAQRLAVETEGMFVDHTYTGKALGALIARVRSGELAGSQTVLFWHTGGQLSAFA